MILLVESEDRDQIADSVQHSSSIATTINQNSGWYLKNKICTQQFSIDSVNRETDVTIP